MFVCVWIMVGWGVLGAELLPTVRAGSLKMTHLRSTVNQRRVPHMQVTLQ